MPIATAVTPLIDPLLGRVIGGRYTLVERIGGGAMGAVYRAIQSPMNRDVAVKILRGDRAVEAEARGRFLREARAMSRLSSPHTVQVLDFGESEGGELFIAMELLEGESLADRLRRIGRFDVESTFDVVRQALRSLGEAHAKGIVHRDLKPANLFFARTQGGSAHEEILKVLDFGIAKVNEPEPGPGLARTLAGTVLGTPCYMSPEQALGRGLDARSDLYSLGIIAYELLAGRPPFIDDTNLLVMARHVRASVPPLRKVAPDVAVSAEVEGAITTLLAKDPAKRPASAADAVALFDRAERFPARTISGVRPALTQRWRSALASAVATSPSTAPSRDDDTVRVRVRSRGRTLTLVVVTILASLTMTLMWTWSARYPRKETITPKHSASAVQGGTILPQR